MKFSKVFNLGLTQAELDFVDIDLEADTPLYLDPYAITTRDDAWSQECHELLVSFFEEILGAIKANSKSRGIHLLSRLNEPEEIRLGVSQGHSKGRGIGAIQAAELFRAMADSTAAKTGLLEDLSDFALFVPGVAEDKISDMTANIIRKPLIEYTIAQCSLFGIATRKVPSGFYWNGEDWSQDYVDLPVNNEKVILLVPRFAVRYKVGADASRYRSKFVLEYLQAEHLRADDSLVTTLRDKKGNVTGKRVYKKTVDKHYPLHKDFLAEFSRDHPDVINSYRAHLQASGRNIPNITEHGFFERDLATHLIERLKKVKPGRDSADEYHSLMIGVISFLLFPNLIYPKKEEKINQGRKRLDIAYANGKVSGLFHRLAFDQWVLANIVHVECKNYNKEIANPEFDQLISRSDADRGRLGILLFRASEDMDLVFSRARDAVKSKQALILPLDDDFVIRCLGHINNGDRHKIDAELDGVYRRVVS